MSLSPQLGSREWKLHLIQAISQVKMHVNDHQADLMARHAIELIRWNKKSNLTALSDPYEILAKHFVDSILAVPFIDPIAKIMDIGSGGGFPGIPIKVMLPDTDLTMVESSRKKANFLKHLIRTLRLAKTHAYHQRVETCIRDHSFQGGFDIVICRALTSLEKFLALSLPLVSSNGRIIALKGPAVLTEIENLHARAYFDHKNLMCHHDVYELPGLKIQRLLVTVRRRP